MSEPTDLAEQLRAESSLVHGRRRKLLIEAAEALESQVETRRQALEEAINVAVQYIEEANSNREYTERSQVHHRVSYLNHAHGADQVAQRIRSLVDQPAPDVVTVPRERAERLVKRIEELREYPWLPDHACCECRPESEMLADGFLCDFHFLEAMIEDVK